MPYAEIPPADEALLTDFFGGLASRFEKSACGAMLERMEQRGFGSVACGRCGGHGIDGGGDWCGRCKGTGCVSFERRGNAAMSCPSCLGRRRLRKSCHACVGTGQLQLTVRARGGGDAPAIVHPNLDDLERFGIASRRVGAVAKKSPRYRTVLGLYYGDAGARWGRTEHGRLFSLYEETPSGRRLAGWKPQDGARGPELTAGERIGVQAVVQKQQPIGERKRLLMACAEEALQLYQLTAAAWIATDPNRPIPVPKPPARQAAAG